jgi:NAD(P)-dependent dehydrogenase (short-subunit alcohol dehydrogenase family)
VPLRQAETQSRSTVRREPAWPVPADRAVSQNIAVERDLFDLADTTAIVTGSSRGIGLAIARALLRQGASVLINGFASVETEEAVEALRDNYPGDGSPRVIGLAGDVTDVDLARRLVDGAVQAFGHVDHLVCNAGIDIIKPAVDYSADEWDHILAVNLRGAFQPAQAAARHWIAQGRGGSITMTSSMIGAEFQDSS